MPKSSRILSALCLSMLIAACFMPLRRGEEADDGIRPVEMEQVYNYGFIRVRSAVLRTLDRMGLRVAETEGGTVAYASHGEILTESFGTDDVRIPRGYERSPIRGQSLYTVQIDLDERGLTSTEVEIDVFVASDVQVRQSGDTQAMTDIAQLFLDIMRSEVLH